MDQQHVARLTEDPIEGLEDGLGLEVLVFSRQRHVVGADSGFPVGSQVLVAFEQRQNVREAFLAQPVYLFAATHPAMLETLTADPLTQRQPP